MSQGFLFDANFLAQEEGSAILSCINHGHWFEENIDLCREKAENWLVVLRIEREDGDAEFDLAIPILSGEDEILQRDVNRTFATEHYRNILLVLLYKCKKKFGDYQQSLSYMAGFLLLFYDVGTTYKILTVLNSDSWLLNNYWRSEIVQCYTDGWVLFDLLPSYLPRLSNYFTRNHFQPNILAISQKWFGGVFIQNVPCPWLLDIMTGLFTDGIYFLFKFNLALLKELEPLLKDKPLHEVQKVIRLLNQGTKEVTGDHIDRALQLCAQDQTLEALIDDLVLSDYRHTAFDSHLKDTLANANAREFQMPLEEEYFSDEEDDLVDDGVAKIQACIQKERIRPELMHKILEELQRQYEQVG